MNIYNLEFYIVSSFVNIHMYAKIYGSWSNCSGVAAKQGNSKTMT